jgi:hypothetical protein
MPADTSVVSKHKITIKGKRVEYQATTGTQPVWNEDGNPIAAVHYTYYERTDIKKDPSRPIMISFNGGPGSGGSGTVTSGTANTGGGGGGTYLVGRGTACGGSGVVILRMPTANYSGTTTGSPTVTTSGSDTILKFTGSGTYTS